METKACAMLKFGPKAKQKSKPKNGQFIKYELYLFDPKKIAQKSKKTSLKNQNNLTCCT